MNSRIAPTPSGFLHQGNAFNFLLTHKIIGEFNGRLLLRIDDIDRGRYRTEYVEHIFSLLDALGIDTDRGPKDLADFEENWSQHFRGESYNETLARLRNTGLVYACSCSRKTVNANAVNGLYAGSCRAKNIPLDQPNVNWRINSEAASSVSLSLLGGGFEESNDLSSIMGDFVIRKKDGFPAYQVCSLTDDLRFGINLIVRGQDLFSSSLAQVWLASLLGEEEWLADLSFIHHPLLLDKEGQKLSKSAGALAIGKADKKDLDFKLSSLKALVEQYWKTIQIAK